MRVTSRVFMGGTSRPADKILYGKSSSAPLTRDAETKRATGRTNVPERFCYERHLIRALSL